MEFPYLINPERRFVQAVLTGSVTLSDLGQTIAAMHGDAAWRPGFDIVWNCAGARLQLDQEDVERLAAIRRERLRSAGPGRDVIVVTRVLDHGMARFYAAMRKHPHRRTHLCASESRAFEILARSRGAEPI